MGRFHHSKKAHSVGRKKKNNKFATGKTGNKKLDDDFVYTQKHKNIWNSFCNFLDEKTENREKKNVQYFLCFNTGRSVLIGGWADFFKEYLFLQHKSSQICTLRAIIQYIYIDNQKIQKSDLKTQTSWKLLERSILLVGYSLSI